MKLGRPRKHHVRLVLSVPPAVKARVLLRAEELGLTASEYVIEALHAGVAIVNHDKLPKETRR